MLDRRTFLLRSGSLIAAAATSGGWQLVGGSRSAVDPRLLALARTVTGPVLTPANPAYARARLAYNERYDGIHPLAVFRPVSISDVRKVVAWAARTHVRLALRSGGHSYAGYSTTTGLVVDLRHFSGIHFDPGTGLATVGAGARLVDVEATLAARGRAVPAGSCATVGAGGLALGGGVGFASRAYGTTSDNIVSLGIVTADGVYRTCSTTQNPDLYWACRGGGGGNFGIVTHFVFRTHPAPNVSLFFADWDWSQAAQVVPAWQAFAPHAPDGLFSICALRTGSASPSLQVFGQFLGSQARLATLLQPLHSVPGLRLTLQSSAYLDAQLRWAGCLGKTVDQCHLVGETPGGTLQRAAFAAKSDYFNTQLTRAGVATITNWIENAQSAGWGSASLLLDSYGGAINRVPAGATAFVHRNALNSGQYLAYWNAPATQAAAIAWLRGFYTAMRPHVSGFAYQNYIDPDLTTWRRAYYGANYPRLRMVKKQVDPGSLFHFPQAIEPA
jgi:FAD/FMN-containing dehydrogenase